MGTLIQAIKNGNMNRMKTLLREGANVNIKDIYGYTPLHYAVESGDIHLVSILLDEQAHVNVKDNDGDTPFHLTVSHRSSIPILRLLLKRGADIDAKNNWGHTPLHLASSWGYINLVRELLHQGANPLLRSKQGYTPHSLAQMHGQKEIAKLLETWPQFWAQRLRRRRLFLERQRLSAVGALNRIKNGTSTIHVPTNVKFQILSKTGLFNFNSTGRNTRKRL